MWVDNTFRLSLVIGFVLQLSFSLDITSLLIMYFCKRWTITYFMSNIFVEAYWEDLFLSTLGVLIIARYTHRAKNTALSQKKVCMYSMS